MATIVDAPPTNHELVYASYPIAKFERTPDGDLIVYGKATDGTVDSDEQIVDPNWSAGAIEKWLDTGGNVRVQHNPQLYPAGRGLSVEIDRDGDDAHWLKALVVEPTAKTLVEKKVLRAFSVGIAKPVIRRDITGKARGGIVTGGSETEIAEISLVDRPANRNCGITLVKSEGAGGAWTYGDLAALLAQAEAEAAAEPAEVTKSHTPGHDDDDGDAAEPEPTDDEQDQPDGEHDQSDKPAPAAPHDETPHQAGNEAADGQDFAVAPTGDDPDPDDPRAVYKAACADWGAREPRPDLDGVTPGTAMLVKQAARTAWGKWNAEGDALGLDGTEAGYVLWLSKRDFDPGVGGGVDRDKLAGSDFVDPARRRFPIMTPGDVSDAVSLQGRANPPVPDFQARLTELARRKGPAFVAALPDGWTTGADASKNITLTSPNPDGLVPYNLEGGAPGTGRRRRRRVVVDEHVAEPDLTKAAMVCPECGAQCTGKRCPECGAKLPKAMRKAARADVEKRRPYPGQRYTHGWIPAGGSVGGGKKSGPYSVETQHGQHAIAEANRMHDAGEPDDRIAALLRERAAGLEGGGVPDRAGMAAGGGRNRRKARNRDVARLRRLADLHEQGGAAAKAVVAELVKVGDHKPPYDWKHGWIPLTGAARRAAAEADAEHREFIHRKIGEHHRSMGAGRFHEAAGHLDDAHSRAIQHRDTDAQDALRGHAAALRANAPGRGTGRVGARQRAFHEAAAAHHEAMAAGRHDEAARHMDTAMSHVPGKGGRRPKPGAASKPAKATTPGVDEFGGRPRPAWMEESRRRQREGMAAPRRGAPAHEIARAVGEHHVEQTRRAHPSNVTHAEHEKEVQDALARFRAGHDEQVRMLGLPDARGLTQDDHPELLSRAMDMMTGHGYGHDEAKDRAAELIAHERVHGRVETVHDRYGAGLRAGMRPGEAREFARANTGETPQAWQQRVAAVQYSGGAAEPVQQTRGRPMRGSSPADIAPAPAGVDLDAVMAGAGIDQPHHDYTNVTAARAISEARERLRSGTPSADVAAWLRRQATTLTSDEDDQRAKVSIDRESLRERVKAGKKLLRDVARAVGARRKSQTQTQTDRGGRISREDAGRRMLGDRGYEQRTGAAPRNTGDAPAAETAPASSRRSPQEVAHMMAQAQQRQYPATRQGGAILAEARRALERGESPQDVRDRIREESLDIIDVGEDDFTDRISRSRDDIRDAIHAERRLLERTADRLAENDASTRQADSNIADLIGRARDREQAARADVAQGHGDEIDELNRRMAARVRFQEGVAADRSPPKKRTPSPAKRARAAAQGLRRVKGAAGATMTKADKRRLLPPTHREPDGQVEALEHDAGMPVDHDQVIKSYSGQRMHDALCPAYDWTAVTDQYPSVKSLADALDPSWFDAALLKAADTGDATAVVWADTLRVNAEALKTVDAAMVADARADLVKAFGDTNGGTITPAQFRRPALTAGHAAANASGGRPAFVPPATHVISPDDFHRGLITEGHQAASPGNRGDNLDTGGSVKSGSARVWYPNASRAAAASSMVALHQHIADTVPGSCPMAPSRPVMDPSMGASNRPVPAAPLVTHVPGATKSGGDMLPPIVLPVEASVYGLTPKQLTKLVKSAVKEATADLANTHEQQLAQLRKELDELGAQPDPAQAPIRGAVTVNKAATLDDGDNPAPVERISLVEKAQRAAAQERADEIAYVARMAHTSPDPQQRLQAEAHLRVLIGADASTP